MVTDIVMKAVCCSIFIALAMRSVGSSSLHQLIKTKQANSFEKSFTVVTVCPSMKSPAIYKTGLETPGLSMDPESLNSVLPKIKTRFKICLLLISDKVSDIKTVLHAIERNSVVAECLIAPKTGSITKVLKQSKSWNDIVLLDKTGKKGGCQNPHKKSNK